MAKSSSTKSGSGKPPKKNVWCVVTPTPGVYLIGLSPKAFNAATDNLWLEHPYIMKLDNGKMVFEPLEVIQGSVYVRLSGQPGAGPLAGQWADKYMTFLAS